MAKTAKKFEPSSQQLGYFKWIKEGAGNAFVVAVAGAGKTTSLKEGAKLMNGRKIYLAFNKKNVDEAVPKFAEAGVTNCDIKTFHSVSMTAWGKFIGKFTKVAGYKVLDIIQSDKDIEQDYHNFVRKLVSLAKQTGIGCTSMGLHLDIYNEAVWNDLVDKHDLAADLGKGCKVETGILHAMAVLKVNNQERQIIDFDDMIYFPILHDIELPTQYDWVMVDEAQDTNPVRRALAAKLVKNTGRMVWVGDPCQAIYGFTGADNDAVQQIIKEFNCVELPLTITYRCPKAVVKAAQAYVSHIEAGGTAPEGQVADMTMTDFDNKTDFTPAKDAILCRKVAPLVKSAYRLIRNKVPCQIEGKADIGTQILAMLNKWKRVKHLIDFLDKLTDWESSQIAKLSDEKGKPKKGKEMAIEAIRDRVETIKVLCEDCKDMECVKAKVHSMFGDTPEGEKPKRVILSTVHKSKGREWDNVYVLGFNEHMPSKMAKQAWQQEQERNLIYVAFTRAMNSLTLVG